MLFDTLPLTWRWGVTVPGTEAPASADVVVAIQRALCAEGARTTIRDATTVEFACPGVTGMSRWALLAPISSGYVNVESLPGAVQLSYALRFTATFWFALAVTVVFWVLQHTPSFSARVVVPFAVLFGGNVATSLWRFPAFLRRTVAASSAT